MIFYSTSIFWPPDIKSWLIWKDPDAGKDWGQEEKGTTEDEVFGWHHWLDGRGFGWTLGDGDGQGGLACCGSWGRKESDMTEWMNWLTDWIIKNPKQHKGKLENIKPVWLCLHLSISSRDTFLCFLAPISLNKAMLESSSYYWALQKSKAWQASNGITKGVFTSFSLTLVIVFRIVNENTID